MQKPKRITPVGPYRLLYCLSKSDKAGVLQELEKGVDPNLVNYDKRTTLHLVSCEGCTEIFILLLQNGANLNYTDRWGHTVSSSMFTYMTDMSY